MGLDIPRRKKYLKKYNWNRRGINAEEAQHLHDTITSCQICGATDRPFHIDHCHKTLKIRGLLCHKCNRAIGFFNDNPSKLRKAADYLDRYGKIVYN